MRSPCSFCPHDHHFVVPLYKQSRGLRCCSECVAVDIAAVCFRVVVRIVIAVCILVLICIGEEFDIEAKWEEDTLFAGTSVEGDN